MSQFMLAVYSADGPRKPMTDEEWWESVNSGDKRQWLTAFFAETSGIFEVIRTDDSEICPTCGGRGVQVSNNTDGSTNQTICPGCNGAQKYKKVIYR